MAAAQKLAAVHEALLAEVGLDPLLIGADGLNSWVRGAILPDAPLPEFTGQGVWRYNLPRAEGLDALLPRSEGPETRLMEAMRYAALGPGKRLRPFFALETGKIFDLPERPALRAACALECIHAYSLIHDDLPAMDNDDLRRGKPTVHKAFDEATAVLAGDSLHALAFEVLADEATHEDPFVRSELVLELARASGPSGMAGGQAVDLASVGLALGALSVAESLTNFPVTLVRLGDTVQSFFFSPKAPVNGWILAGIVSLLAVTAWITVFQRINFVYRTTTSPGE